ncbi:MAG: DUF5674 family protein [Candidatus Limnocylindria bacterium]
MRASSPAAFDPREDIVIVREQISVEELARLTQRMDGELVKAVVDVHREIMAVGARFHAELEAALIDDGSQQTDVWGINLYPARYDRPEWLEFDSVINLRPRHGNRTRSVDDPRARDEIASIVDRLVMP